MNDGTLTNNTYCIFKKIYGEYLSRKKNGKSREESTHFTKEDLIQISDYINLDDLNDCLDELKNKGFIKKYVIGVTIITSDGINFMENRLTKKINKIIELFGNLKK